MRVAAFAASVGFSLLSAVPATAQNPGPPKMSGGDCAAYSWDVSHELDVLAKPSKAVSAGTDGRKPVHLDLDQHYAVRLAPQGTVQFPVKTGKETQDGEARAGVLSFRTPKAGRYRISLSTGHWLDVTDGPLVVVSSNFQAQRGCAKLRKVVEFELSGNRDFGLQLSGSSEANVDIAVTQVKTG